MSKADLLALAKRIAESDGRATMLPVIEKELLHYEILLALDNARLLERRSKEEPACAFASARLAIAKISISSVALISRKPISSASKMPSKTRCFAATTWRLPLSNPPGRHSERLTPSRLTDGRSK